MSIVSGSWQASAMGDAADAQRESASKQEALGQKQLDLQEKAFEYLKSEQAPFSELGNRGVSTLSGSDSQWDSPEIKTWDSIRSTPIETSPAYQWKKDNMERGINSQLAARGKYFSGRAASEALTNANLALLNDEYERDYGRKKDTYQAGLGERALKVDDTSRKYHRALDLVKIKQGAAASTGQGALQTAAQQGATLGQMSALSQQNANQLGQISTANAQNMVNSVGTGLSSAKTGIELYDRFKGPVSNWWNGSNAASTASENVALRNYESGGSAIQAEEVAAAL